MAAQVRGIQPLAFGTTTITGYVNDTTTTDSSTEELVIEDELGDIITQITGFGVKHDVTLEVIPKSSVNPPAPADVFTYGSEKIVVINLSRKKAKKDVEKWTIKGMRYPAVSL